MEGKEEFLEAGGEFYHYIPCLNDGNGWANVISNWTNKNVMSYLAIKALTFNFCYLLVFWIILYWKEFLFTIKRQKVNQKMRK